MKLALGTVQFGINYGINNKLGIPSDNDISEILKYAYENGIKTLDTAISYGNSEERIGKCSKNKFKIISKFSSIDSLAQLESELEKSLFNLKTNKLFGFIYHNANDLINKPYTWQFLMKLKHSQKIEKIGFSIYSEDQLNKLFDLGFIPDLVQLPYSILDRRMENSLIKLKKYGIETHTRSVFLQGLYFKSTHNIPKKLKTLKPYLKRLNSICLNNNISMSSLALNFVNQNKYVDKIVIGAESIEQLKENIDCIDSNLDINILELISHINVKEKELLNPVNWN